MNLNERYNTPIRKCRVCGFEIYNEDDLDLFVSGNRNKYGKQNFCRKCHNKANNERRRHNPDGWRETNYKYLYGISLRDYNKQLERQDGKCYGCGIHTDEHKMRLSVDHCHTTDKIRGLLCNECNRGIGMLKDNPKILRKLADYIDQGGIYDC